jgi:hypothetical protein
VSIRNHGTDAGVSRSVFSRIGNYIEIFRPQNFPEFGIRIALLGLGILSSYWTDFWTKTLQARNET